MIKFFGKIRKKLIDEENLKRYFIYAIGEILLVMIGILLALQVNNWNANKIAKNEEKSILIGIKNSLQTDLENAIGDNIEFTKRLIQLTDAILEEFKNEVRDSDTLNYGLLARNKNFSPNTIFHIILQSKGADMISNEELRYSIINIYNIEYKNVREAFDNELHNVREIYRPTLREWFDIPSSDPADPQYISIDYSRMLKDRNLKNAITISRNINTWMNKDLQQLQLKVETLIHDIEKELERF